jgi:hypothetical protein
MSRTRTPAIAALLVASFVGSAFAADDHAKSSADPNCKVVERQAGSNDSGSLSTSVQAGSGRVSAQSSGGNGVTVRSGDGSTSSSIATTTGSGGQTTVTASDGSCTIYVNPGEKKD